jgi:hypothetical protein
LGDCSGRSGYAGSRTGGQQEPASTHWQARKHSIFAVALLRRSLRDVPHFGHDHFLGHALRFFVIDD